MQFRALKLFRVETCIVIKRKWIANKSVFTLFHDETSFKQESQQSVLLSFNTDTTEFIDPDIDFNPKLYDGNIIRAIWHHNIPSKDSVTTVKAAIVPAIDELNEIGAVLYKDWINLRRLMKTKLAVMSDQNTGALLTNRLIGEEFNVECLVQCVCLMHNLDNTLIVAVNRLP